ncbi:hypothetical protein NBM05_03195 [Rothia sp. AR01]|uniref:Uncharacterized protein n=1 Tax=Rothia santali TaxID=2949643 RepID=A0A9X2KGP9_9MICC|nr:hypothetical protein [Rothia santali]MCP3425062.1 hypothetical protein [Rothia santali]
MRHRDVAAPAMLVLREGDEAAIGGEARRQQAGGDDGVAPARCLRRGGVSGPCGRDVSARLRAAAGRQRRRPPGRRRP